MLRILDARSSGAFHFGGGLAVKPDPDDPNTLQVKTKARFEIVTVEDCEAWSGLWPGIVDMFERSADTDNDEHWPGMPWKRTGGHALGLELTAGDYDFVHIANVAKAVLKLSGKARRVDCSLVLSGVTVDELPILASLMLGGLVNVESINNQLDLFGEEAAK